MGRPRSENQDACVACGLPASGQNTVTLDSGTTWVGAPTCPGCDEISTKNLGKISAKDERAFLNGLEARGVPERLAMRVYVLSIVRGRIYGNQE